MAWVHSAARLLDVWPVLAVRLPAVVEKTVASMLLRVYLSFGSFEAARHGGVRGPFRLKAGCRLFKASVLTGVA